MICMCDCFKHAPYRIYTVANALEVVTHSYFCDEFFAALHTSFTRFFYLVSNTLAWRIYISIKTHLLCLPKHTRSSVREHPEAKGHEVHDGNLREATI